MKTQAQRDAARNKRRAKKEARQNAVVKPSSASIWEAHGKVRIYLNDIGLEFGEKCYLEALECGVANLKLQVRGNRESLSNSALGALKASLNISGITYFKDLLEAIKASSGKVTFQL